MSFKVRHTGSKFPEQVEFEDTSCTTTISELKEMIAASGHPLFWRTMFLSNPVERIRLAWNGQVLWRNENCLADYALCENATIIFWLRTDLPEDLVAKVKMLRKARLKAINKGLRQTLKLFSLPPYNEEVHPGFHGNMMELFKGEEQFLGFAGPLGTAALHSMGFDFQWSVMPHLEPDEAEITLGALNEYIHFFFVHERLADVVCSKGFLKMVSRDDFWEDICATMSFDEPQRTNMDDNAESKPTRLDASDVAWIVHDFQTHRRDHEEDEAIMYVEKVAQALFLPERWVRAVLVLNVILEEDECCVVEETEPGRGKPYFTRLCVTAVIDPPLGGTVKDTLT